jgi:hypothetical protein
MDAADTIMAERDAAVKAKEEAEKDRDMERGHNLLLKDDLEKAIAKTDERHGLTDVRRVAVIRIADRRSRRPQGIDGNCIHGFLKRVGEAGPAKEGEG